VAARLAGGRRQHEQPRAADGFVQQPVADRVTERGASRVLAGEGEQARGMALDLGDQRGRVERVARQLVVVAGVALGQVGEADAVAGQLREFRRHQQAWGQPGLEQRAPEQVAGVGVVGALGRRAPARGGAAEHQRQPGLQQVGQDVALSPPRHARPAGNR
jgi:hypothetical protein